MTEILSRADFHAVIESIRAEANISSRTGQMDRLLVAAATLERDRAALLAEVERRIAREMRVRKVLDALSRKPWAGPLIVEAE